jgi:trigger factor
MKVEVVSREGESQTLEIELNPDEVNEEFKRAFNRYRKSLVVPGFRKGKAPNGLLRRKFGAKIEQEVRETLLKAYSLWAMDEQNINLIDAPKAESLVPLQEGKPFSFRLMARANVVPAVRGYARLPIRIPPVKEVTDEKVNETLGLLRKRYATLKPVEGPEVEVSVSDRITVDAAFLGREDAKVLVSAADEVIEVLSAETTLFGQKLVGRRPGEEVIVDYTVPDDFPDEKLRGNQVLASIKIKEIKKLELPPLDDSLAKIVGEGQTLAGLCEDLRLRLRAQYEEQFNQRRDRAVFERLLENNPIEVHPKILKTRVGRTMVSMIERGLFKEDSTKEELDRVADSLRPIVLDTVRYEMLMAQVALHEGITATQEDIERAMRHGGLRPKGDRDEEEYLVELFKLQLDARKKIIELKTRQFLLERLEVEFISDSADEEVEAEQTSQ